LLYGGSVKPDNISQIADISGVDGVLVGSASLNVESFFAMIDHKDASR
jgi:triosephosphate isomerase